MTRPRLHACLLLLLILFPSPSLAQGIFGYTEAKGFAYFERATDRDPWGLGWGTLFVKWEEKFGGTQLTASLRVIAWTAACPRVARIASCAKIAIEPGKPIDGRALPDGICRDRLSEL